MGFLSTVSFIANIGWTSKLTNQHFLRRRILLSDVFPMFRDEPIICSNQQKHFYISSRNFFTTNTAKLRTLFNEEQQKKITTFINKLDPKEKIGLLKLRCLNKVVASLPEKGPLQNLDDLLEKHSLSSSHAISACNTILQTIENPVDIRVKKPRQQVSVPRKLLYLQKAVKPKIIDPMSIYKFGSVVITEGFISHSVFQDCSTENQWESQKLTDWNVCCVSNKFPLPEVVESLWRMFPDESAYVVQILSSRGADLHRLHQLYGVIISLICAKKNFESEMKERVFLMNGRAPAREFNFLIGNEIVSPLSIVSTRLSGNRALEDHVFSRSLDEVQFEDEAIARYQENGDDMREPLCQSLLLGKAFIQLLKEPKRPSQEHIKEYVSEVN